MAVFVASYTYASDSAALRDEVRARHRAWLTEQPGLLVSGPTDASGAVLVFEAPSATAVETLLDGDPFATTPGIIAERTVVGWTVVTGRLQEHFPA